MTTEGFKRAAMKVIRDDDHAAALRMEGERLRAAIADLLKGTGFEIDYDHYDDPGKVVLQHVSHNPARGYVVDTEVPLDG